MNLAQPHVFNIKLCRLPQALFQILMSILISKRSQKLSKQSQVSSTLFHSPSLLLPPSPFPDQKCGVKIQLIRTLFWYREGLIEVTQFVPTHFPYCTRSCLSDLIMLHRLQTDIIMKIMNIHHLVWIARDYLDLNCDLCQGFGIIWDCKSADFLLCDLKVCGL